MQLNKKEFEEIFVCTKCGDCCKGFGGTVITNQDVTNISQFLKLNEEYFIKKYCIKSGNNLMIAQKDDKYCVFWDKTGVCDGEFFPLILS